MKMLNASTSLFTFQADSLPIFPVFKWDDKMQVWIFIDFYQPREVKTLLSMRIRSGIECIVHLVVHTPWLAFYFDLFRFKYFFWKTSVLRNMKHNLNFWFRPRKLHFSEASYSYNLWQITCKCYRNYYDCVPFWIRRRNKKMFILALEKYPSFEGLLLKWENIPKKLGCAQPVLCYWWEVTPWNVFKYNRIHFGILEFYHF